MAVVLSRIAATLLASMIPKIATGAFVLDSRPWYA
jgi:hypothetical protein